MNKRSDIQPPKEFDPGLFFHPKGHPRKRVILHDTGGNEPPQQFVSLNGFPFLIVKNQEVSLPVPVIEMLKTRVYTLHERKLDEYGREIFVERTVPRFAMTILPDLDEDEPEPAPTPAPKSKKAEKEEWGDEGS